MAEYCRCVYPDKCFCPPEMFRATGEIEEHIRGVNEALRMVADPWIKRNLGRERRDLKDELTAARERLKAETMRGIE